MNCDTQPNSSLSIKDITALSLMGALMFSLQVAMSSLPNIHVTAVLIILTAVFYGWKCLYSIAVFIMLEGLVWGFGLWWLCYWYLWPALAIPAILLRRSDSALFWAILAAIHGLLFGALCSIPYLFLGGWHAALAMWISGLSFDLLHCIGNFVFTLILFRPLKRTMARILKME